VRFQKKIEEYSTMRRDLMPPKVVIEKTEAATGTAIRTQIKGGETDGEESWLL
jgi:hypothetical protein